MSFDPATRSKQQRQVAGVLSSLAVLLPGAAWAQVSTYQTIRVVDPIVHNTDRTLNASDTQPDSEDSIAINPQNPNELVILGFAESFTSSSDGALFHSLDSGATWTKTLTIPQPPGITGFINDQTLDWGRNNNLNYAVLTTDNIVSVVTNSPTSPSSWDFDVAGGSTQLTNHLAPSSTNSADQPWTLTNRDPFNANQDNVYTAYDDFSGAPDMHVAVSYGVTPLNFSVDVQVGTSTGGINPGLRLAKDPTTGFMYALWQRCTANCGTGAPPTISYMLNRSTDGGHTWALNGSSTGVAIASGVSTQPTPKFGTVNALLGGVDHAAVDPRNGALYYAYGTQATNVDRMAIRRLTFSNGNVTIGSEVIVTNLESAIPQVAVDTNGTVAVFFYSFDGIGPGSLPDFTAHLSLSANQGATFTDRSLLAFQSPDPNDGTEFDSQRVLGDYQQMKSLGTCFYGTFTANGAALGRPFNNTDPIYFQVCQQLNSGSNPCVLSTGTVNVGLKTGDRTQITASVESGALLQVGSNATITGNATVNANAFLQDNATIAGNLTLAGVLQHQNIFTITGSLTQNALVTIPRLASHPVTAGTGNQTIAGNATVTLPPGQYGNMTIGAGAKVTLLTGTYNFLSLNVQPDIILTDNAATSVNVAGSLTWSDRVKVQSSLAQPLTLYTNATSVRIGTDGIFKGFLVAPGAELDISSRTSFQGCVGAHDITFEPDVTLTSGGATLPPSATM